MTVNPILKKAFEDIEKHLAEKQAHDSSPADEPDTGEDTTETEEQDYGVESWDDLEDQVEAETGEGEGAEEYVAVGQPADTSAPRQRHSLQVKGLDEKAVLVQLKRSMFGTSRRDEAESAAYGAGNVVKHLFEDKSCRMAKVKQAYSEVYTYVNENTVPWGKGVRILNIDHYFDFTTGLRQRIDHANAMVADLEAHWDAEVNRDLSRLAKIETEKGRPQGSLADPDNYPDASEIGDKFGIEVRYMPVPTTGDFRVTISDEDKASLQKQLEDAEDAAARHVIEEMLEPMQRAVDKLSVPIGQDGSIFRDSLIDNMVEVADRMERVNISDDPAITEKINDLRALVAAYADNKDVLRNSQSVRTKAATQIDDLVKQMGGLV